MRWRDALVTCVLILAGGAAAAWGAKGHRLVAELAQERLDAKTAEEVSRLLRLEGYQSLADVSTWADEIKDRRTARWHFVNFEPGSCKYDAGKHCRGGECAVGAVVDQLAILGSHRPDAERLQALKFVVHLVADLHQPLHAGFAHDKGGNEFQVRWAGRGTNLHAVWDSGIFETFPGGVSEMRQTIKGSSGGEPRQLGGPRDWAEASCRIAQRDDMYPKDRTPVISYQRWAEGVAVQQLDRASWALAGALKMAMSSR